MKTQNFLHPIRFCWNEFMKETSSGSLNRCVTQRTESIGEYHGSLGPPDLICITAKAKEKLLRGSGKESYFTYCYGMPMASETILHMFIYENFLQILEAPKEKGAMCRSLKKRNFEWMKKRNKLTKRIKKIEIRVYNVFSGQDVSYILHVPGKSSLSCMDIYGNEYEQSQIVWQEVFVSSMLRLVCADDSIRQFVIFPEFKSYLRDFTDAFIDCLRNNEKRLFLVNCLFNPGPKERSKIFEEMGQSIKLIYSVFLSHGEEILSSFYKFFINLGYIKDCLFFFTFLAKMHLPALAFASKILMRCRLHNESLLLLSRSIYPRPSGFPVSFLRLQASSLLKLGNKKEEAFSLIQACLSMDSESLGAWLILTKILLEKGDVRGSLEALNAMGKLYSRVEEAGSRQGAVHSQGLYYTERVRKLEIGQISSSKVDFTFHENDFEWILDIGNEKLEDLCQKAKILPAKSYQGMMKKMYKQLVNIENQVGIHSLLKMRESMFILSDETSLQEALTKSDYEDKYVLFGQEKRAEAIISGNKKAEENKENIKKTHQNTSRSEEFSESPLFSFTEISLDKNLGKYLVSPCLDSLFYALYKDHELIEWCLHSKTPRNEFRKKGESFHPIFEIHLSEVCRRVKKWQEYDALVASFESRGHSVYADIRQCNALRQRKNKEKLMKVLIQLISFMREKIFEDKNLDLCLQKCIRKTLDLVSMEEFLEKLELKDPEIKDIVSNFVKGLAERNDTFVIQNYFEEESSGIQAGFSIS